MVPTFKPWPKTPRLHSEIVITEKIDGTNAAVIIEAIPPHDRPLENAPLAEAVLGDEVVGIWAQSRKRVIDRLCDNFGFAQWVEENAGALFSLGVGHHYGEWWGHGIQRGYGLERGDRRFSLFEPDRYAFHYATPALPHNVNVVPVLGRSTHFDMLHIEQLLGDLYLKGSFAVPGYDNPEGLMIYHAGSGRRFKWPLPPGR